MAKKKTSKPAEVSVDRLHVAEALDSLRRLPFDDRCTSDSCKLA
jgi:hypothetical protein